MGLHVIVVVIVVVGIYIIICGTLRSGLHGIPKMIRTFQHEFENNHECKWVLNNIPGIIHMSAFLKNCQKSICMYGCSPIHMERS